MKVEIMQMDLMEARIEAQRLSDILEKVAEWYATARPLLLKLRSAFIFFGGKYKTMAVAAIALLDEIFGYTEK